MKNNLIFITIVSTLAISITINFKYFKSLNEQLILISEFNNSGSLNYSLDVVKDFNNTFPNITVTTLPISLLIGRYYLNQEKIEEGLKLIHNSINENPYLGVSEYELSRYYLGKNIDSVYFYSKIAFNKLPRNNYHTKIYFTALSSLKKEKELDSAFNTIKKHNSFEQWKDYIFSKLDINESNRPEMQNLLDNQVFFDKTKDEYITLQTLVNIGFNGYSDYKTSIIKAEALFDQKRLKESAVVYDEVSVKNPTQYLLKENAAIAYYKAGMYQAAINYFQFVIDNFTIRRDAKSEFYLGLTLLTAKNEFLGCTYLELAKKKNFAGAKDIIEKFCYK